MIGRNFFVMWRLKFFIFIILVNFSFGDDCGRQLTGAGLSIGGDYSSRGQWPWLAPLFVKPYGYICGSSIISKEFLLGAAHCVHSKDLSSRFNTEDFHALLGAHALNDTNNRNSKKVNISEIFLHPDWDSYSEKYDGDVALFKMEQKIDFTSFIQPICLPEANAKVFEVEGTVAGYGFSENSTRHENRPKHVEIRSVTPEDCLYDHHDLARIGSKRMFCAGENGKNPCKGDSGGPFMIKRNEKWIINGIVSSSKSQECHENDFVLFTQVPKFLGWIKENMEGRGQQLECRKHPRYLRHYDHKTTCFTESLKILEPNLRVTSISLDKRLNFNEIELIWIYGAEVHYLPDFSIANEKFPNFKKLDIQNSGLKELDRSKLALLPQLIELSVYGNQIQELPEDVFDDLINLEVLWIGDNQVKILPQKLLWKFPKLKKFYAWRNQIEAIPARFFEMNKNIEEIYMSDNKISRIEIDLRSLPKLKKFYLYRNQCIDKIFREDGCCGALTDKNEIQRFINENCRQ